MTKGKRAGRSSNWDLEITKKHTNLCLVIQQSYQGEQSTWGSKAAFLTTLKTNLCWSSLYKFHKFCSWQQYKNVIDLMKNCSATLNNESLRFVIKVSFKNMQSSGKLDWRVIVWINEKGLCNTEW